MKSMRIRQLAQKVASLCLTLVVLSTYSMVSLAASIKPVGELLVSGTSADGNTVTVNGEPAKSGRTLFANSIISTPDGVEAVISLGKSGKFRLAPGSTFTVSDDSVSVAGSLTSGQLTLLNGYDGVSINNSAGESVKLNSGETASATSAAAQQGRGPGGLEWWKWALIAGGVITVIIIAVAASGDDDSSPISPIR